MGAGGGGRVFDEYGLAVAGDGGGEGVPLVGGEVVGVFEAIGLAGQRREPRLCETSMAQWRQLHLHPGGGLAELAEAQDAGGIVRVGAGEELLRVGDAVAVAVEVRRCGRVFGGRGGGLSAACRVAPVVGAADWAANITDAQLPLIIVAPRP